MIRVGLARTDATYAGLRPPYGPGRAYPELRDLLGSGAADGPPNPVYAGVRAALRGLGLDASRFGGPDWNPLGALVERGARVVLKPNFIRHYNPVADGSVESVITHGAVVRAVADYAALAVGTEGSVTIAEAPQQDCDFERIRELAGLDALVDFYAATLGRELEVIDLRTEAVDRRDGVIVSRRALPGDPRGYRTVDLGPHSFFEGSGLEPSRYRGADYDPGPTVEHHRDGRNEYLLSETVLSADLVVNLPKLKCHKKTGVTLALKNLVGINGDKNWLPHHTLGSTAEGGDEYPGSGALDRLRSQLIERARGILRRGRGAAFFRGVRRLETAVRGDAFVRSGNWHGNRTTWRMCLDLNRCLYYSDAAGLHLDAPAPVRTVLSVMDAIVGGEGQGPLAPRDVPVGAVLAATDPVALDLVAIRLMGFAEDRIPKVREAMRDTGPRVTAVRAPDDVCVLEVAAASFEARERSLDEIVCERPFEPHSGWFGHVERRVA
ncbi:MAG: DUF362 domain-containing protein [Deltaproteobacteria bacterium]|nr:MAG: DUF362 domain-containing protein [Deltaproteobacteria bacterium]